MSIELYGHVPFVEIGKLRNLNLPKPPAGEETQITQLIKNSTYRMWFSVICTLMDNDMRHQPSESDKF